MKHSFCEHPAYTPSPSEDNSALPPQNGQVSSDCQCGNLRSNIITPPVPGRDRLSFIKTFHPHTASITGNTVQCQPVAAGAVYRDISTSAKRTRFKFLYFSDLLTHTNPRCFSPFHGVSLLIPKIVCYVRIQIPARLHPARRVYFFRMDSSFF